MSRQPLLRGSTVPWDPVPDPRSAIPPKQLKVDMSVEARQLLDDTRELFGGHVEPSDDLGAVR